jgi:hypothetical protein
MFSLMKKFLTAGFKALVEDDELVKAGRAAVTKLTTGKQPCEHPCTFVDHHGNGRLTIVPDAGWHIEHDQNPDRFVLDKNPPKRK